MPSPYKPFSIGYVSRVTGLTPHVIRVWEKRYAVVTPHRSSGNRRLYSQSDIRRLSLLQNAVKAGQSISGAAGMSDLELLDLAAGTAQGRKDPGAAHDAENPAADAGFHVENCWSAVLDLDGRRLENALVQAAVDLPRLSLLTGLISTVFDRIGRLWADGSIRIIHEHLASTITQGFLWEMLRNSASESASPAMVVATPTGQWCQIGAVMAAVAASDAGWEAHYFGPNLPAQEIAAAAKHKQARCVALGIASSGDPGLLTRELTRLRSSLPPGIDIVLGGGGSHAVQPAIETIGARRFQDLRAFFEWLNVLPADRELP